MRNELAGWIPESEEKARERETERKEKEQRRGTPHAAPGQLRLVSILTRQKVPYPAGQSPPHMLGLLRFTNAGKKRGKDFFSTGGFIRLAMLPSGEGKTALLDPAQAHPWHSGRTERLWGFAAIPLTSWQFRLRTGS